MANRAAETLLNADQGQLDGVNIRDHWLGWDEYIAETERTGPRLISYQSGPRVLAINIAPVTAETASHG